jgi:hypothetical protein
MANFLGWLDPAAKPAPQARFLDRAEAAIFGIFHGFIVP